MKVAWQPAPFIFLFRNLTFMRKALLNVTIDLLSLFSGSYEKLRATETTESLLNVAENPKGLGTSDLAVASEVTIRRYGGYHEGLECDLLRRRRTCS